MRLLRFSNAAFSLGIALACLVAPAGSGLARGGYTAMYDNTVNQTGFYYSNGGASTLANGDTITTMVADDITAGAGLGGHSVNQVAFTVYNPNSVAVTTGIDVRFYADDGSGGVPTTLLAGLNFAPLTLQAGGASLFTYSSATSLFTMPTGLFWAGITFDDGFGTTGATADQLNNLGQLTFDPPGVGSSNDYFFQSTSAGSFDGGNPPGGLLFFGGAPVANFGWSFSTLEAVPEPSSLALVGVAGLVLSAGRLRRLARGRLAA